MFIYIINVFIVKPVYKDNHGNLKMVKMIYIFINQWENYAVLIDSDLLYRGALQVSFGFYTSYLLNLISPDNVRMLFIYSALILFEQSNCTDWIIFLMYYIAFAVMLRLSINWKSIKKRVFTFWFNTRENALILLI